MKPTKPKQEPKPISKLHIHKQTPHYLTWRETVADWMAEPRQGVPYHVIAPV